MKAALHNLRRMRFQDLLLALGVVAALTLRVVSAWAG